MAYQTSGECDTVEANLDLGFKAMNVTMALVPAFFRELDWGKIRL